MVCLLVQYLIRNQTVRASLALQSPWMSLYQLCYKQGQLPGI